MDTPAYRLRRQKQFQKTGRAPADAWFNYITYNDTDLSIQYGNLQLLTYNFGVLAMEQHKCQFAKFPFTVANRFTKSQVLEK